MDDRLFDTLTRALSTPDSRRRLLGTLAALPVVGGLVAILDPDDAEGQGRRQRRKQRHKRRKNPGNRKGKRKKPCKAESAARTCAGKCGSVTNNCKQPVACGSCDCSPACAECFTCQGGSGAPGTCVPQEAGTSCGAATTCDSGTLFPQGSCDGDGNCLSGVEVPCDPYQCDGNACATSCASDGDCVAGSYCDGGQCVGDLPDGETCVHGGQCTSGFCVDSVCCDTACTGDCQACNNSGSVGICQCDCPAGTTECGGQCVDTHTDADHCGACDTTCGSGQVCRSSACFTSCIEITGCFGTGQCPRGGTTGACAGTSEGTPVCIALNDAFSCQTDAQCESQFGAGHVCLTDVGSESGCQSRKNKCAYW